MLWSNRIFLMLSISNLPLLRYISNMLSVYCCVATQHDKWSQHLSHGWVWYIYSCNVLEYCYILRTELQLDIHLCFFTSATLTSLCTYFTQVLLPWKKWEITKVLLATSISQQDGSWMLDGDTMITQAVLLSWGKVHHSYSSKKPLRPWLIIKWNGCVVCSHYMGMAWQGETCALMLEQSFTG